jgi:hypothetical protein
MQRVRGGERQWWRILLVGGGLIAWTGCGADADTVATAPQAEVLACEPGATVAVPIAASERAALEARGGFLTQWSVSPTVTANDGVRFRRITDALAAARRVRARTGAGSCRIEIAVAAGTYVGATSGSDTLKERLPLVVDMPDVTLRGAYVAARDTAGRPLAPASGAPASVLVANPALTIVGGTTQTGVSEPLVVINTEPASIGGDGAVVEGFVFRSGHAASDTTIAGKGILTLRAANVLIRGNSFEGNFTERIDLRVGSAAVVRNYLAGLGETCDICVAGPGVFRVDSNRVTSGGIPGVLIVPATILPVPTGVTQTALGSNAVAVVGVTGNEITGHQRLPVGVGIRIATMGIGAPNVQGITRATIERNVLRGNRFGMIVEAGFPVAGSPLRGDAVISTAGNTVSNSCQADLYVAFTRHTVGLGLANQPYLRGSTYQFQLGADFPWDRAWFAHADGNGNLLQVNGAVIPPGRVAPYTPAACP